MKLSVIIFLLSAAILTGCNSKSDKNSDKAGGLSGKIGSGPSDLSELALSEFKWAKKISFKDSEKVSENRKKAEGENVEGTKFFLTILKNEVVDSKNIDKAQARCEISTWRRANENVDNLFLDDNSEPMMANEYKYNLNASETNGSGDLSATLKLKFSRASGSINFANLAGEDAIEVNCWQVTSKAELNNQLSEFLSFKKREKK
jgi:hypothetical protein